MDCVVVSVMLLIGQGAKIAFNEMALSNQKTIELSKDIRTQIDQIATWISKHKEHEELVQLKVEGFKRKLDSAKKEASQ